MLPGGLPPRGVGEGDDAAGLSVRDDRVEPFGRLGVAESGSTMDGGSSARCLRTSGARCGVTLDAFETVRARAGLVSAEGGFGSGGTTLGLRPLTVALGVAKLLADAVVPVDRTELTDPGRSAFANCLVDEVVLAVALVVRSRAGAFGAALDFVPRVVWSEPGGSGTGIEDVSVAVAGLRLRCPTVLADAVERTESVDAAFLTVADRNGAAAFLTAGDEVVNRAAAALDVEAPVGARGRDPAAAGVGFVGADARGLAAAAAVERTEAIDPARLVEVRGVVAVRTLDVDVRADLVDSEAVGDFFAGAAAPFATMGRGGGGRDGFGGEEGPASGDEGSASANADADGVAGASDGGGALAGAFGVTAFARESFAFTEVRLLIDIRGVTDEARVDAARAPLVGLTRGVEEARLSLVLLWP